MKVEVILRQVGEECDLHRHAPHTLLLQRMAAHLHHRFGRPGGNAIGKDLQQITRFRRGVLAGAYLVAHVGFDRSEQHTLASGAAQYLLQQPGGGGLAVGAGDGAYAERTLRMPKNFGSDLRQRAAAVIYQPRFDAPLQPLMGVG